jgi:hypothetical protein
MQYSAEKYIPGLGNAFKIHPDHINVKGGAEKHIPGLGSLVYIDNAKHVGTQGGAEKYLPGLGKDYFINPAHVK